MKPLISVVIPVFNHAHCLERSLFSLYKQTYRPIEVIIIDDGSKDNFKETIHNIRTREQRNIKTINQNNFFYKNIQVNVIEQENKGASAARNRGMSETKGDYVIFWDVDTIASEKMLERMLATLESNPMASYAYSQYRFGWKKMKSRKFDADSLQQNNYIDTTSLIRRSAVIPFDGGLKRFQDWDLWLSMLEQGKVGVFVPEVLFKKIVDGRVGISNWLPSFFYRLPWQTRAVREYETARQIVLRKHSIREQTIV